MSRSRPSRRLAAAAFAGVGLSAGAAHVLVSDSESLRLWREALPLAGLTGALLGAVFRPNDWLSGASTSFLALPAFSVSYGLAETAIIATQNEITGLASWIASIAYWAGEVLAQAAIGGAIAILAGATAGLWLGRHSRR